MYIVSNTTIITKGDGHQLIQRFNRVGEVEKMEGFLGLEVFEGQRLKDHDEVTIMTRWENEEAFKRWTESDAFKAAHRHRDGKPDFIIDNLISYYTVPIVREPITAIVES